ncbi:MAG: 6,7-dimethyl-8-ribityllumazine synthase [Phycisphaerales bacterium JB043]
MSEYRAIEPSADARGVRVAVVASRYHDDVIDAMVAGAIECFERCGGDGGDVTVVPAPGAFELPTIASSCIASGWFDVFVVLGCIVRGETRHDEVIADAIASQITHLACEHHVAIGFGVLTVETLEQALARAGGEKGNKGAEAMQAALEAHTTMRRVDSGAGVRE